MWLNRIHSSAANIQTEDQPAFTGHDSPQVHPHIVPIETSDNSNAKYFSYLYIV